MAKHAMESEASLGMKIMYNDYMNAFDPLLDKPGRTAISDSFVEDVGNKFREVCSKDVSLPDYSLTAFGKLAYRSTFQRCLDFFSGYKIV